MNIYSINVDTEKNTANFKYYKRVGSSEADPESENFIKETIKGFNKSSLGGQAELDSQQQLRVWESPLDGLFLQKAAEVAGKIIDKPVEFLGMLGAAFPNVMTKPRTNKWGDFFDIIITGARIPGMHKTTESLEVQSQEDLTQWMVDIIRACAQDEKLMEEHPA